MSTEREVNGIVRSWLEDGVNVLPDRVLDAVLDQLPATPQRRAGWLARRSPLMNNALRITLAAAAVVVIAFLGIRFLAPNNTGGPLPTATPSPAPLPASGVLQPGSYEMSNAAWTPARFSFRVPAGWAIDTDGFVSKHKGGPDEVSFASFIVTHVFAHACTRPNGDAADLVAVGPAVDDLANALAGQQERTTTGPTDVTLGGLPAKRVDLTAPADLSTCGDFMRTWPDKGGDVNGGWGAHAGQSDAVYVVDVGGTRVVIDAWHLSGASAADRSELAGIIASIQFAP
jgi:hypothetical protein